jgi:hypothetical protein
MAYLYRHIRLDKNEPFYIGIGNNNMYRLSEKRGRNVIWKKITNKTKYEVEILLDNLTWEDACKKEIEFINLYGRIDIKTGCLANMTNGGEGTIGRKYTPSLEHRQNLSKASIGKKMSNSAKDKMSKSQKLPILQYDLEGNFIKKWDGIVDASKEIGKHSTNIARCCQNKYKQAYGFIWKYKYPEKMGRKPRESQIEELKQIVATK